MKFLMSILVCLTLMACATPRQKEQNQYIRTIQKAQRAVEFGRSEIATGKETIIRGEKRVKENEAIIAKTQQMLDNMDNTVIETVIEN